MLPNEVAYTCWLPALIILSPQIHHIAIPLPIFTVLCALLLLCVFNKVLFVSQLVQILRLALWYFIETFYFTCNLVLLHLATAPNISLWEDSLKQATGFSLQLSLKPDAPQKLSFVLDVEPPFFYLYYAGYCHHQKHLFRWLLSQIVSFLEPSSCFFCPVFSLGSTS